MSFHAEKALKHRVVMLVGDESILRRQALDSLLQSAGVTKDDFDLEIFDADAAPAQHWLASAGTAPFLSERRTVVVRHMFRCDPDTVRKEQIAALPDSALLILVFDDEVSQDDKASRTARVTTGWKKLVEGGKGLVCTFSPEPKAAKSFLKEAVAKHGKKASETAIDVLLEMSGGSLSHAIQELDKVALFVGDEVVIQESDMRAAVAPSREWNVFKMIEAIVSARPAEALRQLRIMVGKNSKAEEVAFRSILPLTSRQLKLLWQARTCVEAHCQPAMAPPEVARTFLDKPNLGSEQPYRQSALMNSARRVDFRQLTVCFSIVSDADARLKGSVEGFNPMDSLERMVLDMCAALRRPR